MSLYLTSSLSLGWCYLLLVSCVCLFVCLLFFQGHYRRGVALSKLARYEEAMQAFQKCLDLNPKSADYQAQFNQAKKDLYKGLSEAEILKLEGNEVSAQHTSQETRGRRLAERSSLGQT